MVQSRILIDRRSVVLGGAAGLIVPKTLVAAERVPTPGQTEGPFYPTEFPADMDNDLVRVAGQAAQALGQVTLISGHVVDMQGQPQRGTTIEIWQCDAKGIYRHPRAPGQGTRHRLSGLRPHAGRFERRLPLRTIRPVPYPGRTPHIHFAVHVPGRGRLVTQMYIEGEPLNARDGLLNGIRDQRARRSVLVALSPATGEAGALQGQFDIVVA